MPAVSVAAVLQLVNHDDCLADAVIPAHGAPIAGLLLFFGPVAGNCRRMLKVGGLTGGHARRTDQPGAALGGEELQPRPDHGGDERCL